MMLMFFHSNFKDLSLCQSASESDRLKPDPSLDVMAVDRHFDYITAVPIHCWPQYYFFLFVVSYES